MHRTEQTLLRTDCWGNCSATREMWHDPGWYEHVDLDTTYPILCRLLGTDDIVAGGSGGDLSLPGVRWGCFLELSTLFFPSR